jgi:N-carbamoylputrescine amidase
MSLKGAEMLIYPTAIGWNPFDDEDEKKRQRDSWIVLQRSHAIANGLHVLSINRTGFEADPKEGKGGNGIDFWGSSFICGPQGEIILEASISEEELLIADIDKSQTESM